MARALAVRLLALALVGVPPPAVAGTCVDDLFEENDSVGEPAPVTEGSIGNLRSCELDDDYFSLPLSSGDEISIVVSFSHAEGDIDLALIDPSGTLVASSQSTTDDEQIVYTALGAGTFVIRVHLFADSGSSEGNDYWLDIAIAQATPVPTTSPLAAALLALILGLVVHRVLKARTSA